MAVLYLGINNKSKQVSKFYIGNGGKAKEVTRGYIGVGGKAKIFYESNLVKKYPTFREGFPSSSYTYQANRFYFNYSIDTLSSYYYFNSFDSPSGTKIVYDSYKGSGVYQGTSGYTTQVPYYVYYISTPKCFLNENSQNFFKVFAQDGKFQQPRQATAWLRESVEFNIEKFFLFNKVQNMYSFSDFYTGPTLVGNILHLNLNNIKDSGLCGAFRYMERLTGNFICPDSITSLWTTYMNCKNLTGPPVCTPKITGIEKAYVNCTNLDKADLNFYGGWANYAFQGAKIYGNIYLHNTEVNFNYICDNRTNNDLQLNIYIRSSIPVTSIYKTIGYGVSSYTTISTKNYRLVNGSTYSNVYINNSLTS